MHTCIMISAASTDKAVGGLPRFYSDKISSKGMVTKLEGDEFWHLSKVLRLGADDKVELFDGRGGMSSGRIKSMGRTSAEILVTQERFFVSAVGSKWHVAAAFGRLKGGRADWLVEKCTELGAAALIPLETERCNGAIDRRTCRWQRIILSASKQCQRLHMLELQDTVHLQTLTKEITSSTQISLLATADAPPLVTTLNSIDPAQFIAGGTLIVGPEGDFSEREKQMLVEAGALAVGLGPRRLRVETAAIAMLATVMMMTQPHEYSV